jgi:hypothetical protein
MLSPALLLTACLAEANQPGDTLPDSTEARVVPSTALEWIEGHGWSIAESALLDLANSGTGPPGEFERVTDGIWLVNGRIVVADDGWREVRFSSPSGDLISSVGRPGEGPGEFRRIQTISPWREDSILVFGQRLDKAAVLSEIGGVRTIVLANLPHRPEYLRPLGDSGLIGLFSSPAFQPPEPGAYSGDVDQLIRAKPTTHSGGSRGLLVWHRQYNALADSRPDDYARNGSGN